MNADEARRRAQEWSAADPDPDTAREVKELLARGADAELTERFGSSLEFGTAGLRGVLGGGPNRMNRAVVRRTTAGFARYLKAQIPDAARRGVVVGRDARRLSREFAEDTAAVLAAEGIPALCFVDPVPTPVTAFAVTHLGSAGAVMITASHNPPEYNGYKVYWENGAQIIPPHDHGIASAIEAVEPVDRIALLARDQAQQANLWAAVPESVGRAYLEGVARLRLHPDIQCDLKIAYTALHGVGGAWFEAAMSTAGIGGIQVVAEQQVPDPAFPTVAFPNPEEPGAMDLTRDLAERIHADLALANDPDADRLAVMVRDAAGKLQQLTGNEVGVLLGHYLLTHSAASGRKLLAINSIVSSPQLGDIARRLGVLHEETLTGFKWIANRALQLEREIGASFIFGYEEALGYTVGTLVRDKDGIGTAVAFAELAAWCRFHGSTPVEYLEEIQRRFGLYISVQRNFSFPGAKGAAIIAQIMEGFRRDPLRRIGELAVLGIKDYGSGVFLSGGQSLPIQLPSSNVIAYELEGGSRVTLRPSGTEPKIKYYFELKESLDNGEPLSTARERSSEKLRRLEEAFIALARNRGNLSQV
jgi:phosphomannomutase